MEYTYVDATDDENVRRAIKENTKLIFLETPANPTMGITDLSAVVKIAGERKIPVCVDTVDEAVHVIRKNLEDWASESV